MGFLSAIWNLIKKIFSAVLGWITKLFSKFFWIILIIVVIWFAPVIAAFLLEVGAPTFLVTAFETIAIATPYVQSAGMWLWSQGSSLVSTAWQAYRGLDAGTQAAVALGVAAAIAPEETAALLDETIELATSVGGSLIGALARNPTVMIAAGVIGWWFLFGRKKHDNESTLVENQTIAGVSPYNTVGVANG